MTTNQLRFQELQELKRKNLATERETNRSNLARELETNRSNRVIERGNALSRLETHRSNVAREEDADKSRTIEWFKAGTNAASTLSNAVRDLFINPRTQRKVAETNAITKLAGNPQAIADKIGSLRDITELANAIKGLIQ